MIKKIVITGIGDTRNNGCWAMVYSFIDLVRNLSPIPVQFIILTRKTAEDHDRLELPDIDFVVRPWTTVQIPKIRLLWQWFCFFSLPVQAFFFRVFKIKRWYGQFWKSMVDCDLVVDLSGDSLSADYNKISLATLTIPLFVSRILGKKIMFCAQSIGPFTDNLLHKMIIMLLKEASVITTRERITDQLLAESGVKHNVLEAQDLAFTLKPVDENRISEICLNEGIDRAQNWVGISISNLISQYAFSELSDNESKAKYVDSMAQFSDYIVDTHDKNILFIPHVSIPGISEDLSISQAVHHQMRYKNRAKVVGHNYRGNELKGIIGLCQAFIGSRMHATIAAFSQKIPTLTYVYNHKTIGINGDILLQKDYLIDIRKIKSDQLLSLSISCFDDLLINTGKIRSQLSEILPEIRKKATRNVQYAIGLLDIAGPLQQMSDPLLCTGCGACTAVCKTECLNMQMTPEGTLRPYLVKSCVKCNICHEVCPIIKGLNVSQEETRLINKAVSADVESGDGLTVFKGYSDNPTIRSGGSSGGLVSEVAVSLLENDQTDAVLVTGSDPENPFLTKPYWATDRQMVMRAKGSKYTPVSLLQAFNDIPENTNRLTIIGLPCHLWALRQMEKTGHFKDKEIVLKMGLFCGRTPSANGLSYLIDQMKIEHSTVKDVSFRGDGWPGGLTINTVAEKHFIPLDKYWSLLGSSYFCSRHCFFCPDFFAHLSDISFGDAWLPECKGDQSGWSVCISRSARGDKLLEQLSNDGRIHIEKIPYTKLKMAMKGNFRKKYQEKLLKNKLQNSTPKIIVKDGSAKIKISLRSMIYIRLEFALSKIGNSYVLRNLLLNFPANHFTRLVNRFKILIQPKV